MLHVILVVAGICTMGMAMPLPDSYSYSPEAGGGSGSMYSTAHEGRITGVRIWEYPSAYIAGIQLKYGGNWTDVICTTYGAPMELELFDNEYFVEVAGKEDQGYIFELMFVNNHGKSLKVGQPSGNSFHLFPAYDESELRFISGRQNGYGITAVGAHWAVYKSDNSVTP